jgi:hypothetical protein
MSERWPPEWGDPDAEDLDTEDLDTGQFDTGEPDNGHLHPGALAEQLVEVSSALASIPTPALPDVFAARIGAAIAAEAATRTEHSRANGVSATARSVPSEASESSFPAAANGGTATGPRARSRTARARRGASGRGASRVSGPAGSRPPGRWRERLVSAPVMASLVICLVVAGFGYLVTVQGSFSSSSSSAVAGSAASGVSSSAASASGVVPYSQGLGKQPLNQSEPNSRNLTVTASGTRYEPATLAGQVRDALAVRGASLPAAAPVPSSSASAGASTSSRTAGVSAALAGCVNSLTGDVRPSLFDRATYAGRPVYVIALAARAWVVGLGCSAANTELITTVSLAGLSGNLCALGSV